MFPTSMSWMYVRKKAPHHDVEYDHEYLTTVHSVWQQHPSSLNTRVNTVHT